jgi:hypothetical protein
MKKTKLNEANYYSQEMNKQYFSVSQYKDFCKCEAMAMAKINGTYEQPKSKALLLGSLVDELLTGDKESQDNFFIENKDELFKKNGEPYADVAQALETIERIKKQPLMMKHLSGEHQVVMTGKIAGVPFKIKMDSYHPDKMIVDLKYMSSLRSPNMFDSMVKYWSYDIQGAVYQEIVRQNTGKRLPFYLDIGTKEKPAHLDIAEIKQYDLDAALDNVISRVPRFDLVKQGKAESERCEEYDCDYCTTTRIITEPIDSNQLGMARKFF